jgi:hypothetical protein
MVEMHVVPKNIEKKVTKTIRNFNYKPYIIFILHFLHNFCPLKWVKYDFVASTLNNQRSFFGVLNVQRCKHAKL